MRFERLPTLDEIRALPRYLTATVPEAYLDQNGHMNIQHYLGIYDDAGAGFFGTIGIEPAYFTERRMGVFDLEHHISYLAECHAGDQVSVYGRMLARTPKRIHAVWFLTNDTRGQLSNVFEFITSHADLEARRTSAFPEDVATRVDAIVAEHEGLSWPAPLCGVMKA